MIYTIQFHGTSMHLDIYIWSRWPAEVQQSIRMGKKGHVSDLVVHARAPTGLNGQHDAESIWATVAEDHTSYHTCQVRTGNWGAPKLDIRSLENRCLVWWALSCLVSIFAATYLDIIVIILHEQHESKALSCLLLVVHAGANGVMVWGIFS